MSINGIHYYFQKPLALTLTKARVVENSKAIPDWHIERMTTTTNKLILNLSIQPYTIRSLIRYLLDTNNILKINAGYTHSSRIFKTRQ